MIKQLFLLIMFFPTICVAQNLKGYKKSGNGILIKFSNGILYLKPLTENAIRVQFGKDLNNQQPELILTSAGTSPEFKVTETVMGIELHTAKLKVILNKQTGALSYFNASGTLFLKEKAGSRILVPDSIMEQSCYVAGQSFDSPSDEYLFGLGQFQDGFYNLRNNSRRLFQVNTQIAIPFIYSSKGYGLLWHQYGLTDFNPTTHFVTLKKQEPLNNTMNSVEGTSVAGNQKIQVTQTLYTGNFNVPADGTYSIMLDLIKMEMACRQYVVIDGKPCIDQSSIWLSPVVSASINLKAGEHQVQVISQSKENLVPKLSWKQNDDVTTFRSPNAKQLDYIVFYGPSADSVIATYRNLSGNVPMLPLWAYGFWQCRERYSSGEQLVETIKEFRRRNLPVDVIVQDWQYWGKYGWGVMKFDESKYPNPSAFIKELHDLHAHLCISIWENVSKESDIGKEHLSKNLYIPQSQWLDMLNPITRQTHWNAMNENLFSKGMDAWWMDAVEPENDALKGMKTYLGLGDFYRLTYPLFVAQAVYEGQRKADSAKRVCILTRSAYAGEQRYGIINWSGDIQGTWDSYKKQIVAGLNYSLTGMPYWTTDIGGFFRPGASQYTDKKYHELLTRWFQWGALNPIFRIHGYQSETEPWKYGGQVEDNMRKILNLRYRLLPYIYSEAWQVTKNGYTLMRPLVMDFKNDTVALKQSCTFMFGHSFLVTPVTEPGVEEWDVYLPRSTQWFNFWTGKKFEGGQTIKTSAPLSTIPLFVKAGSIVPISQPVQYTGQLSISDTLEIRIYHGANGKFDLYEDEGDNYNYEKGIYSIIPIEWNDDQKILSIGKRQGKFTGELKERTFTIVWVNESEGGGIDNQTTKRKIVKYKGDIIRIKNNFK